MAEVIEFGAMYYNTSKITNLSGVVCPPWDMITKEMRAELIENEPYNFANVILPEGGEDKYHNAMNMIFSWLLRDVLIIDNEPSFYIYEQEFKFDGQLMKRRGFVGLLKIEDYGANVKRHERTFPTYVDDRLALLKETQTELESIFFVYKDQQKQLDEVLNGQGSTALLEAQDEEGNTHRIIKVTGAENAAQIKQFMSAQPVYIADGHHRYETALRMQKAMAQELGDKYKGKEPFNYILGAFFNVYDPAIKILPTHRLVKDINIGGVDLLKRVDKNYKIAAMEFTDYRLERAARIKLRKLLNEYKAKGMKSFGVYVKSMPNKYFLLTLKDEAASTVQLPVSPDMQALDVVWLDNTILAPILSIPTDTQDKQIYYVRGDAKALDLVKTEKYDIAFIMNPVEPTAMVKIADNNGEMPQKTTDFYPKLLSGLMSYSYKYSKMKF